MSDHACSKCGGLTEGGERSIVNNEFWCAGCPLRLKDSWRDLFGNYGSTSNDGILLDWEDVLEMVGRPARTLDQGMGP